jgi:hypothetical protein
MRLCGFLVDVSFIPEYDPNGRQDAKALLTGAGT